MTDKPNATAPQAPESAQVAVLYYIDGNAVVCPQELNGMTTELAAARRLIKEICVEWNEGCDQECDSIGHTETCKATHIAEAKRALHAQLDAALAALRDAQSFVNIERHRAIIEIARKKENITIPDRQSVLLPRILLEETIGRLYESDMALAESLWSYLDTAATQAGPDNKSADGAQEAQTAAMPAPAAAPERAGGMPEEPHVVTHLREQHPSKLTVWEGRIVEYVEALVAHAGRLQARVKELESGAGFARAIVDDKLKDAREQAEARLQEALAAIRELPYIGKDLGWTEWRKKYAAIIEIAQREKEKKDECHYDAV